MPNYIMALSGQERINLSEAIDGVLNAERVDSYDISVVEFCKQTLILLYMYRKVTGSDDIKISEVEHVLETFDIDISVDKFLDCDRFATLDENPFSAKLNTYKDSIVNMRKLKQALFNTCILIFDEYDVIDESLIDECHRYILIVDSSTYNGKFIYAISKERS